MHRYICHACFYIPVCYYITMFSLSLVHTSWRLRMPWPRVNYTRWRSSTLTSTGHECREPRRDDSRGGRTNNRTSSRPYLDDETAAQAVSIHILQLYMDVWTVASLHPYLDDEQAIKCDVSCHLIPQWCSGYLLKLCIDNKLASVDNRSLLL